MVPSINYFEKNLTVIEAQKTQDPSHRHPPLGSLVEPDAAEYQFFFGLSAIHNPGYTG